MIVITLSEADAAWAIRVGRARNKPLLRNRRGYEGSGERIHIFGAAGELAFCRATGIGWPAHIDTFGTKPDVPPNIEVKTRLRPEYDLLLSDKDGYEPEINAICIHVTTATNQQDENERMQFKFLIQGWWDNSKPRQDEWKKMHGNREPAHFIPLAELNTDFSRWGISDPPVEKFDGPDLHDLIRRFSVYSKIPAQAWADWDRANRSWRDARLWGP